MAHRIFLSYSTRDQAKADSICAALEAAGMPCWIATRDIEAGSRWGGSIVEAIEAAEAVLILFSSASNASPQVVREMEVAVANRKPLIPVRIENEMPTEDMKYFLGVSHWLSAFEPPFDVHLPEIVAAARRVLDRGRHPFSQIVRALPRSRQGQILAGASIAALALIAVVSLRPSQPTVFKLPESPLTGRWEATLEAIDGHPSICTLSIEGTGQARFSDTCPSPLAGSAPYLDVKETSVWAPGYFEPGDTGSFLHQGGSAHGFSGAFKLKGKRLTTRDAVFGEVTWKKVSASQPMRNALEEVVPQRNTWPLENVPSMAARAKTYARAHWRADAVLLGIEAKLLDGAPSSTRLTSDAGSLEVSFRFYSPDTQEGMLLMPGATYSSRFEHGAVDWNADRALPDTFLDLDDAVRLLTTSGMRAKGIKEAELQDWGAATYAGGNRLSGVAWRIRSAFDEYLVVPAAP